jgi:hypothetical protein
VGVGDQVGRGVGERLEHLVHLRMRADLRPLPRHVVELAGDEVAHVPGSGLEARRLGETGVESVTTSTDSTRPRLAKVRGRP